MDTLYIVMPAWNEEANIETVVRQWYPLLEGKGKQSRLVVADSGSTDRTHEILCSLQNELPQLEVLSETGRYHGPKVIALYKLAADRHADYVFQTDSDGQTDPAEFGRFWKNRRRYEGIFGARRERGDGQARAFVEKVVCLLLRLYFGVRVPDANAPFRLMHARTLGKYLPLLPDDYELPNIILTACFVKHHEKTAFPVITFKPRLAGKNSINIRRIVKIGWKALGDFHRFRQIM